MPVVSDIGKLFADLTAELEDLHGLAVEGQASGQAPQVLLALADSVAAGLQRVARTLLMIRLSIDADA